jgi:hypothetical protein
MDTPSVPLYINDSGVVMCYGGCDGFTFEGIGRRTTVGEFLDLVGAHWADEHEPLVPEPNYEHLLWKYINHVGDCEGVDFLSFRPDNDLRFTPEEWAILREIADRPRPEEK